MTFLPGNDQMKMMMMIDVTMIMVMVMMMMTIVTILGASVSSYQDHYDDGGDVGDDDDSYHPRWECLFIQKRIPPAGLHHLILMIVIMMVMMILKKITVMVMSMRMGIMFIDQPHV